MVSSSPLVNRPATVVRAVAVEKSYGARERRVAALRGLDLAVSAGEFVAIMGRSGCGKTTLLNLLGAMDQPDRGEIWLEGRNLPQLSEEELTRLRRQRVGFVFQFFNLLPTLTVRENVELPLLLQGETSAIRARVDEVLVAVDLHDRAADTPAQLSGGQMQRVALARALVHRPVLLIADEPTGNLDSISAEQVLTLLKELPARHGAAVVMATHSSEAARFADRVLHMKDGQWTNEAGKP